MERRKRIDAQHAFCDSCRFSLPSTAVRRYILHENGTKEILYDVAERLSFAFCELMKNGMEKLPRKL